MRIRIYVEGPSERAALPKLLAPIRPIGARLDIYPLKGSRFLSEIGFRAGAVLRQEKDAHVFACPDLAPKESYQDTRWAYRDYDDLAALLEREVRTHLRQTLGSGSAGRALQRFHPHPFRHDFEVVLLACPDLLKRYLGTRVDITRHYRKLPEDQNFADYPKRVIRKLFAKFTRRRYDPVSDCPRILDGVTAEHLRRIEELCPRMREFLAVIRQLAAA